MCHTASHLLMPTHTASSVTNEQRAPLITGNWSVSVRDVNEEAIKHKPASASRRVCVSHTQVGNVCGVNEVKSYFWKAERSGE